MSPSHLLHPTRAGRLLVAGFGAAALLALGTGSARAYDLSLTAEPKLAVPDGDLSGLASVITVPAHAVIRDIDLTLDLPGLGRGGWNGDLYVLLSHGGVASVLVNRPGRTGGNVFGYGDNGLVNVTFDDDAASGDFHAYQTSLGAPGDSRSPISGAWAPDARAADPLAVTDSDPRSAFLDTFTGGDAAGDWVLFVADLSTGGHVSLDRWTLNITFDTDRRVPDTGEGAFLLGALVIAGLGLCRARSPRL